MSILKFENYSFSYGVNPNHLAIQGINFCVEEGEIVAVCGKSGSGKSTLIKCIKKEITPAGNAQGVANIGVKSRDIAIVFQDPDTQLISQTVINDLVFHMENLGFDNKTMKKNLAETVGFFGLEPLLHKPVGELSGGQKQLVSLCAALMTKPKLLLLDEPTSQLDPIATRDFWDTVARIHEEFGIAIIITEHRLDDIAALSHKTAVMKDGAIVYFGKTEETFKQVYKDVKETGFIPHIPLLSLAAGFENICFTPRQFKKTASIPCREPLKFEKPAKEKNTVIAVKNVFFAYENSTGFILKNMYLDIYKGERLCILGGNGAGKTTLLRLLCKIIKPISGQISKTDKKPAYMPQNIKSYFRFETVREELEFDGNGAFDKDLVSLMGISGILDRHPFDISGGEAQRVVLAALLMRKPSLLVLDEPTKGLDPYAKKELMGLLNKIDTTIVLTTHDVNFAAEFASRCAMIFDGSISFTAEPHGFFSSNSYYTTPVNLGVRHICANAVTFEEGMSLWHQQ